MGIEIYDGGFGNFCAIGDEIGLFICVNKDRKAWYPTQDRALPSEFELKLLEEDRPHEIAFKNGKMEILRI